MTQDTWKGTPWAPWTQNLYAYVGNNPVNMVDPTGHMGIQITDPSGGYSGHFTTEEPFGEIVSAKVGEAVAAVGESLHKVHEACRGVVEDCDQVLEFLSLYTGTPEFGMAVESFAAAKATNNMLRAAVAESAAARTWTVWDTITATDAARAGTTIPKTFVLRSGESTVWVHANATRHMAEHLTRNASSLTDSVAGQQMLESFKYAVDEALKSGLNQGRNFLKIGGWELGINTETNTIYHARMLYQP